MSKVDGGNDRHLVGGDVAAAIAALLEVPSELTALRSQVADLQAELAALRRSLPPALVTVQDAAERLGISVPTVRRMVRRGELSSVRVGASIRIDLSSVRPASDAEVAQLARAARGR